MSSYAKPPSPGWTKVCRPLLYLLPLVAAAPLRADYTASSGSIVTEDIILAGETAFIGGATLTGSLSLASGTNTIVADAVANTVISGVISGPGDLVKTGSTKLVLSGANTYTGTTTISNGVLDIATGGQLGSGAIINNSLLTVSTSQDVTLTNVSGTGSITKGGTGQLTLAGTNTTTGTVTVGTGDLVVTGSFAGNLVVSGSSALTVSGSVGGNVNLVSGADFALSGSVSGSTALTSGSTLTLAGSTSTGSVSIANGSSVVGTGAIGATTLASGGTLSLLDGPITLTSLTWTTSSTAPVAGLYFDLNNLNTLTITGAFNRASNSNSLLYLFDFNGTGTYGESYALVNFATTNASTALNTLQAVNLSEGLSGTFSILGNTLYLTVVPEPAEYAVAFSALVVLIVALRIRARRRQLRSA